MSIAERRMTSARLRRARSSWQAAMIYQLATAEADARIAAALDAELTAAEDSSEAAEDDGQGEDDDDASAGE